MAEDRINALVDAITVEEKVALLAAKTPVQRFRSRVSAFPRLEGQRRPQRRARRRQAFIGGVARGGVSGPRFPFRRVGTSNWWARSARRSPTKRARRARAYCSPPPSQVQGIALSAMAAASSAIRKTLSSDERNRCRLHRRVSTSSRRRRHGEALHRQRVRIRAPHHELRHRRAGSAAPELPAPVRGGGEAGENLGVDDLRLPYPHGGRCQARPTWSTACSRPSGGSTARVMSDWYGHVIDGGGGHLRARPRNARAGALIAA